MATKGKQERVGAIVARLKQRYKDAHCALHHETPFQLLIATILSAQCTDERVNQVTPRLFAHYPTPENLAVAPIEEVEELIHSTGFYKNKAKNIIGCSQQIVKYYQGELPRIMDKLVELPGVGRKTANVVLGNAFGIASGVVVDTHVLRLSNRFGWIRTENAEIGERQLMKLIPESDWVQFSHWMIFHGRQVCSARSPQCKSCFLQDLCPQKGVS
jgi:endonuclease-3